MLREEVALARGATVAQARRTLVDAFRNAGLETPDLDARLLAGHALGLDHAALAAQAGRTLTDAQAETLSVLGARRLAREPVARILGEWEFWGLPLRLDAETLVPRPETETLVEAALAAVDASARGRALRVADLGTGSGAILLALLSELPHAVGVGSDASLAALVTARANAARLGLSDRAGFVACDFGAALAGGFDLVASNPPYIATGDLDALSPEVHHDPVRALDGGADGLGAYRAIAADAGRLLAPGGALVLELGIGQAAAVTGLLRAEGLFPQPARPDLSGIPRALTALLPA